MQNWLRFRWRLSARLRSLILFTLGMIFGSILTIVAPDFQKQRVLSWFGKETLRSTYNPAPFQLPINPEIETRLRYYLKPGNLTDLIDSYKRSGTYIDMITAILEEYNLPVELRYLPILESRFMPHSQSNVGAVGLWQIMPATASQYGLKYNRWIDERRDPERATIVAAEYLRFLYDKFQDWNLVLAAYNCGFSKLRRAMRADRAADFWQLKSLPRETRNFVPNYYAILHIINSPEKHGVALPAPLDPLEYETIELEATFSIDQIAKLAKVSPDMLKSYNPALISDIAPSGAYSVRVPTGIKDRFLEEYKKTPLESVEITYTTYRIRRGDTLGKIAKRFGTTIRAIMADNNLRSSRWIKAGMQLRIATIRLQEDADPRLSEEMIASGDSTLQDKMHFVYRVEREGLSVQTLARYYSVSVDDIRSWNPWLDNERLELGAELNIYKSMQDISVHRARRGDSLWKLARRHHTSVSNLKRWNQLTTSRIFPGSSLIVSLR